MKTYNKITRTLQKTVSRLRSLAARNTTDAVSVEERAANLIGQANDLNRESARATTTADKIEALLS